jgi:hypothetical protein
MFNQYANSYYVVTFFIETGNPKMGIDPVPEKQCVNFQYVQWKSLQY